MGKRRARAWSTLRTASRRGWAATRASRPALPTSPAGSPPRWAWPIKPGRTIRAERGFAERCLQAGREVYELGRASEGAQQGNSYKEPYRYEETTWADDMEWGAAELFRATGERRYVDEARRYARLAANDTWMDRDQARHYQYYPFQNAGHFRLFDLVDRDFQTVLTGYYREGIERCHRAAAGNPYRVGVPFIWCSNNLVVALVTQCYFYERMTGDARYRGLAARNRDWLLGRNPWGYSMFTEVGRVFPTDVHLQTTKLTGRRVRGGSGRRTHFRAHLPGAARGVDHPTGPSWSVSGPASRLSRRHQGLCVQRADDGRHGIGHPDERGGGRPEGGPVTEPSAYTAGALPRAATARATPHLDRHSLQSLQTTQILPPGPILWAPAFIYSMRTHHILRRPCSSRRDCVIGVIGRIRRIRRIRCGGRDGAGALVSGLWPAANRNRQGRVGSRNNRSARDSRIRHTVDSLALRPRR